MTVGKEASQENNRNATQKHSTKTYSKKEMFEGVPDQFHQFIASRTTSVVLPLPLSFPPLHGSSNTSFPSFVDPYSTSTSAASQQVPLQPNFLHPLMHQGNSPVPTSKNAEKHDDNNMVGANLDIDQKERLMSESVNPWTNDEVLALLRIRSSLENWIPEFTWEHVSRKLAEVGFKRSAEKCKEKFEEESRYFGSNINYNKNNNSNNYRVFSEFEEIYHGDQNPNHHPHHHHQDVVTAGEKNKKMDDKPSEQVEERDKKMGQNLKEETRLNDQTVVGKESEDNSDLGKVEKSKNKKRKREKKFEIFKGFCEDIVNKMMREQEEMHNKLLEDMVKRDKEKFAREEAWKKQEMDRIDKDLQLRAHEQAVAGDRQVSLINFLKKFTSTTESSSVEVLGERSSYVQDLVIKVPLPNSSIPSTSSSLELPQNPNLTSQTKHNQSQHEKSTSLAPKANTSLTENQAPQNPSQPLPASDVSKVPTSSTLALSPQNPNSVNNQSNPPEPTTSLSTYKVVETKSTSNGRDDIGKRWPRDEVLALINLRCSLYNNNNEDQKEGSAAKAPLWERISQGMLEMGYKRSAKRCKEKWENINKYFRKTKDNVNKKRSIDSRTCPYFHQLSTLYNQGTLVAPDHYHSPENQSNTPETGHINNCSSRNGNCNSTILHNVAEGGQKKNMFQAPAAFDFDF